MYLAIAQRSIDIHRRTEFGYWENDTIIGKKSNNENIILNILECKTIYAIILNIVSKTANVVMDAFSRLRNLFG